MRIAILVWGSLFWDPRNLSFNGNWHFDGPLLPIEFARISSGNRLTLVINRESQAVQTLYCISAQDSIQEAIINLAEREGTINLLNIGFIGFESNRVSVRAEHEFILPMLRDWNTDKKFDAIIWSDFGNNFVDQSGMDFTFGNIVRFLTRLNEAQLREALRYIVKTPQQVGTDFRRGIQEHFHI
jgi:hypothetical protein